MNKYYAEKLRKILQERNFDLEKKDIDIKIAEKFGEIQVVFCLLIIEIIKNNPTSTSVAKKIFKDSWKMIFDYDWEDMDRYGESNTRSKETSHDQKLRNGISNAKIAEYEEIGVFNNGKNKMKKIFYYKDVNEKRKSKSEKRSKILRSLNYIPRKKFDMTKWVDNKKYVCAKHSTDDQMELMTFLRGDDETHFLEKHHIIRLKREYEYKDSIDEWWNLVPLCPKCHREVHFGSYNSSKEIILKIIEWWNKAYGTEFLFKVNEERRKSGLETFTLSEAIDYLVQISIEK